MAGQFLSTHVALKQVESKTFWLQWSPSVTIQYCNWRRPLVSKRLTLNLFYCYVFAQKLPSHRVNHLSFGIYTIIHDILTWDITLLCPCCRIKADLHVRIPLGRLAIVQYIPQLKLHKGLMYIHVHCLEGKPPLAEVVSYTAYNNAIIELHAYSFCVLLYTN